MDKVTFRDETHKLRLFLCRVLPKNILFDSLLLQTKYLIVEKKFIRRRTDPFTWKLYKKNQQPNLINDPTLADKISAKKFVHSKGIPVIPTIKEFIEKDDNLCANQILRLLNEHKILILKGSCASGQNYLLNCTSTSHAYVVRCLKNIRSTDYYTISRETVYKGQKSRIYVEKVLEPISDVKDIKFHVFRGEAKFIQLDFDRFDEHTQSWWTTENVPKPVDISVGYKKHNETDILPIPSEIIQLAYSYIKKLNITDDYVRIDFLSQNTNIYFAEFTYFPWGMARCIKPYGSNALFASLMS